MYIIHIRAYIIYYRGKGKTCCKYNWTDLTGVSMAKFELSNYVAQISLFLFFRLKRKGYAAVFLRVLLYVSCSKGGELQYCSTNEGACSIKSMNLRKSSCAMWLARIRGFVKFIREKYEGIPYLDFLLKKNSKRCWGNLVLFKGDETLLICAIRGFKNFINVNSTLFVTFYILVNAITVTANPLYNAKTRNCKQSHII